MVETPAVEPEAEIPASVETVELPSQDNGVADESISLPKADEPSAEVAAVKPEVPAPVEAVNYEAKYKEALASGQLKEHARQAAQQAARQAVTDAKKQNLLKE